MITLVFSGRVYIYFPHYLTPTETGPRSSVTLQEEDSNPLPTAALQCHAGSILQRMVARGEAAMDILQSKCSIERPKINIC